ncbi:MAG: STAS domain-containing protein [Acidimicrobiales bacterium]
MSAPVIDVLLETNPCVGQQVPSAVFTLVGEHDTSTVGTLTCEFARVFGEDDSNPVIDLSGVTFMDVSIVNLLLRTKLHLRRESRDLLLRAPSPNARRLLDLCENISPLGFRYVREAQHAEPDTA